MLGVKLKGVRKERGHSLEELARLTGFSKSFLSQIENGKNAPSIASLKKITAALCISIGELFDEDRGDQIHIQRKTDRRPLKGIKEEVIFEFVSSRVANRKMEPLFFSLLPGGESEGEYAHEGEEFGTVLEGTLHFRIAGKEYVLGEGDSIYFSSSLPHRWQNLGTGVMRALWVITPPSF